MGSMRLLFINLLPDKLIVRQVANEDFLKVKSTQRDRGGGGSGSALHHFDLLVTETDVIPLLPESPRSLH